MRAKSDESEIAKIQLKCYEIKEIDLIVVNVNGNYSEPDFSCFLSQAILKVNKDIRQFNISELNVNNRNIIINNSTVWSLAMLNTLANKYRTMEGIPQQTHVMFVINGILLANDAYQVLGYTESIPGYNCWIRSAACQTRTPAHELGHCLGLGHRELDKDALMCQTFRARNDSSRKLRSNEWDAIR